MIAQFWAVYIVLHSWANVTFWKLETFLTSESKMKIDDYSIGPSERLISVTAPN
jgi:hypothetical protein